jgi:GNAT superfamily N-acetyltransferase
VSADDRPTDVFADLSFDLHDAVPSDAGDIVDTGLGHANNAAAPLHEVQALSCFVRDVGGTVIGGAIGRTWGACCELQQLWVHDAWRRQGIGAQLVRRFEQRAAQRGCQTFYLETFSFQAPSLYRALGYRVVHENRGFPHGIVKFVMQREGESHVASAPRP